MRDGRDFGSLDQESSIGSKPVVTGAEHTLAFTRDGVVPLQRRAVDGSVKDLNGMDDAGLAAETLESRLKLKEAARVASGNDIWVERSNQLSFAIAELIGGVGLHEIVNAC